MFILTTSCAIFPKSKTEQTKKTKSDSSKILWIFIFSFPALQHFSNSNVINVNFMWLKCYLVS